jgi:high-affinity Fe2+/Pb2+ permease
MVGLGIHEFNEAGIIPAIIEHVWDMNPVLSDQSQVGLLLKALIGYNGNPSLTSVLGYVGYLTIIIIFFRFHKNYTRPLSIKTNAKSQGTLDTMI